MGGFNGGLLYAAVGFLTDLTSECLMMRVWSSGLKMWGCSSELCSFFLLVCCHFCCCSAWNLMRKEFNSIYFCVLLLTATVTLWRWQPFLVTLVMVWSPQWTVQQATTVPPTPGPRAASLVLWGRSPTPPSCRVSCSASLALGDTSVTHRVRI